MFVFIHITFASDLKAQTRLVHVCKRTCLDVSPGESSARPSQREYLHTPTVPTQRTAASRGLSHAPSSFSRAAPWMHVASRSRAHGPMHEMHWRLPSEVAPAAEFVRVQCTYICMYVHSCNLSGVGTLRVNYVGSHTPHGDRPFTESDLLCTRAQGSR